MSVIAAGLIISAGTSIYAANQQSNAASDAAAAQSASNDAALAQNQAQFEASQRLQQHIAGMQIAAQQGIANQQIGEARRQFDMVRQVLAPFITAGNQALGPLQQYQATGLEAMQGQRDLIGLNGSQSQSTAINALSNSPEMAAYLQQGENAILQNAAATGGLRGGNAQAAMGQFRPSLLAGLISQQYDRLGGLAGVGVNTSSMLYQTGQSAAAGQANAGMQVAGQVGSALAGFSQGVGNAYGGLANASAANSANMANAYNQYYNNQGSIAAGNALAQGQAQAGMANSIAGALGSYTMLQALRGNSGNPGTAPLLGGGGAGGGPGSFTPPNYGLGSASGGGLGLRF
jgi:hypothetical protein